MLVPCEVLLIQSFNFANLAEGPPAIFKRRARSLKSFLRVTDYGGIGSELVSIIPYIHPTWQVPLQRREMLIRGGSEIISAGIKSEEIEGLGMVGAERCPGRRLNSSGCSSRDTEATNFTPTNVRWIPLLCLQAFILKLISKTAWEESFPGLSFIDRAGGATEPRGREKPFYELKGRISCLLTALGGDWLAWRPGRANFKAKTNKLES